MKRIVVLALALAGAEVTAVQDLKTLWNFSDPAASEARFRERLAGARGDDALVLQTQIARTYSLRRRFDDANALLDTIAPQLDAAGPEPRVRWLLERGRTVRSAGAPERARPLFDEAVRRAEAAKLDDLAIDALHMVAVVEKDPAEQLRINRRALALAQASSDPGARDWDASLANNIGVTLHGMGRHDDALASFRTALAARERIGKVEDIRIARWMIAWTLRAMGRHDEALAMQHALEREFAAAGRSDGFVFEEIGENLLARNRPGDAEAARPWFARAHAALAADTSLARPDDARLARLARLGGITPTPGGASAPR